MPRHGAETATPELATNQTGRFAAEHPAIEVTTGQSTINPRPIDKRPNSRHANEQADYEENRQPNRQRQSEKGHQFIGPGFVKPMIFATSASNERFSVSTMRWPVSR